MCVSLLVCFVVCTDTDFSAAKKDRGVKFSMQFRLLSGQVFSRLVNFGSRDELSELGSVARALGVTSAAGVR